MEGDEQNVTPVPAPMAVGGPTRFFAVFGGRGAGVYTDEQKAARAGEYREYDSLEKAMKFYQLGFCSNDRTFEKPQYTCETALSMFKGWKNTKRMCTAYIRGEGDRVGIHLSTENQTFVQEGFDGDKAWKFYVEAIAFVVETVFGPVGEPYGGLLSPVVYNLTICVPDKKALRKIKYPKSPIPLLVQVLQEALRTYPVALVVNPMMCQVQVALNDPKDTKDKK